MNLFEKELSSFSLEIEKAKEKSDEIKEELEKKETEKLNLSMDICELDMQLNKSKIMMNKRLKINKQLAKEQKKRKVSSFIVFIASSVSLILLSTSLLIPITTITLINLLNFKLISNSKKRVKKLIIDRDNICDNKSLQEIKEIISMVNKNRTEKVIKKEIVEKELIKLNQDLEKAYDNTLKIHNIYKMVLDFYDESLNNIESNVSLEERDNLVNAEHGKVMPEMVKRIYNSKNV